MKEFLKEIASYFTRNDEEAFTGALTDGLGAKGSSVPFGEIVASTNPVEWKPLDTKNLPDWPVFDQGNSGSCVAFTMSLMVTIIFYIRTGLLMKFSAKWIYYWRGNKPSAGMRALNVFDIVASKGVVLEEMMPSQKQSEEEINNVKVEPWHTSTAKGMMIIDEKIDVPAGNIDLVASIMQTTGKPIMVWFNFAYSEWLTVPSIMSSYAPNTHSVCFVPPRLPEQQSWGIYKGKKAIVIQDSWGLLRTTFAGKRIITEDFFKKRNIFVRYFMRFKFDEGQGSKPIYTGTIVSLQKCLQYEGCFPMNEDTVENYGVVTRKSVLQFQAKYKLPQDGSLNHATVKKLQELFN